MTPAIWCALIYSAGFFGGCLSLAVGLECFGSMVERRRIEQRQAEIDARRAGR